MYPETKKVVVGYPIRKAIEDIKPLTQDISCPKSLLVLGGSLGAQALDDLMFALAPKLKSRGIRVTHQCREENLERLKSRYGEIGVEAKVVTFIEDMADALTEAHLVVSRAGAGAVREIAAAHRPAIFVPLDPAKGHGMHQIENAELLVSDGVARMVLEGDQFHERFVSQFEECCNENTFQEMRDARAENVLSGAADRIAQGCLELIPESS